MQLSPPHPPISYQVFTRFVFLLEMLYQSFFVLIRLLQKIMHFQNKTNFLIQLILLVGFDFAVLCILFQSSTIMKLRIAYIHSFLFDLSLNHVAQKKN